MKNSRRILLTLALLAISAGGIAGASRWKTAGAAHAHGNDLPPILDRHVAAVHLHGVHADEAIPRLQSLIGVRIVPDWAAMEKRHVSRDLHIWLDFDDIPVGQLMQALTEQLRGYHEAAGFDIEDGAIVIRPDMNLKQTLRVYDVTDLAKDAVVGDAYHDDMETAIRFCLEPRFWSCGVVVRDQGRHMHEDGRRLWVLQTSVNHEQIEKFFSAIRQATRNGMGPFIARSRNYGSASKQTVVMFYDVRDLACCSYHVPASQQGGRAIDEAGPQTLALLVAHRGGGDKWNSPMQTRVLFGRLVVEETPAGQEMVRQLLTDLRAEKPVEGFVR